MYRLWLILLFPFFVACSHPDPAAATRAGSAPADRVEFAGKVVKVTVEGGFCGLVAEDGRRFEAANLPAEFCRDGLPVVVSGTLITGGITTRMWGSRLHIDTIRRR